MQHQAKQPEEQRFNTSICCVFKTIFIQLQCYKAAVPNLCFTTDRFNVGQYFQGPAFKVQQINTTKEHDITSMKTVVVKIKINVCQ